MFEKVQNVLKIYGMMIPSPVRGVILEMASEVDRLRAEVGEIRSNKGENDEQG